MGVLDDAKYSVGKVKLEQSDTLLIFSDGILESQDAHGEEFGYDRLKAELAKASGS